MAGRGQPAVPTKLKLLRGNPGKRAIPKDEPLPEAVLPKAPATLNATGKKQWGKVAKQLYDCGILTQVDTESLYLYCVAWQDWCAAGIKLKQQGMVIRGKGGPIINPYQRVSDVAFDKMRKLMSEFGMTPSSRTRVTAAAKPKTDDPWDKV